MSSNRPAYRITYKAKDGAKYDVGVIWNPKKQIDGLLGSLSPQKTNEDGQYKKMRLVEALARVEAGDGFLDVWSTAPRGDAPQRGGQDRQGYSNANGGDDSFPTDEDIPFMPRRGAL
jgi:hypothetical protein